MIPFARYHALGNDYLVMPGPVIGLEVGCDREGRLARGEAPGERTLERVRRICDRHRGLGSDGILAAPADAERFRDTGFPLRILNPDGSEAEKSGNGLRIYARYLRDQGLVGGAPFRVVTAGGVVRCRILSGSPGEEKGVEVEMGQVSFDSTRIPVDGPPREVLRERLLVGEEELEICAATIGNPHCVVLDRGADPDTARRLGPLIERHPLFPQRTNVQFMEVIDPATLRIEIWERGAGHTLASGSSSCAAAATAHRLGLCTSEVEVRMAGGSLRVRMTPDLSVTMAGPVTAIARGLLDPECLRECRRPR